MDYSWMCIPAGVFLLSGGYFVRRHTLPKEKRYRILLIISGMWILLYLGSFYENFNKINVLVLIGLILALGVTSLILHRIDATKTNGK